MVRKRASVDTHLLALLYCTNKAWGKLAYGGALALEDSTSHGVSGYGFEAGNLS